MVIWKCIKNGMDSQKTWFGNVSNMEYKIAPFWVCILNFGGCNRTDSLGKFPTINFYTSSHLGRFLFALKSLSLSLFFPLLDIESDFGNRS